MSFIPRKGTAGFRYAGTVSLGLEDIGLDWFRLYEKML